MLYDLQARVDATKAVLESQDQAQVSAITRERAIGEVFHAGLLSYFAQYDTFSQSFALQERTSRNLAIGYGSFGYEPNVSYFFSIPRSIQPGGAAMNIRIGNHVATHSMDVASKRQFVQKIGLLSSALEHAVPERMFATQGSTSDGVSTVKALARAQAAGQRIYHIKQTNQVMALPNIHHNIQAMDEIRSALAVGKEVITHTDAISVPGWIGAGYIVLDPVTGNGAYKISGGANGGGNHDFAFALSLSLATLGSALESFSKEMAETKLPLHKDLARHLLAEKIALAGKFLGGAALAADIYFALTDDSLSLSSKAGRIVVAIFGFHVASIGAAVIATTFASPIVAAIIAAFFVATLTIVLADFSVIYLSSNFRSWRRYA